MITVICCMRDSALQAFGQPMAVAAAGQAVRSFQDEVNNPQGELFKHPEDYELYELGSYNDATARFELHDDPVLLVRGKDVIRPKSQ